MTKKALLIVTVCLLCSALSLGAWDYYWYNEPGPPATESYWTGGEVPTIGASKALIIVSKFPEDTASHLPNLFYDSLIAPDISMKDSSLYKWSITNFLYKTSWGKDTVTGAVNPGMYNGYVTAPHSMPYYVANYPCAIPWGVTDRIDTLERDLIHAYDPYVDYNNYDANGDGFVDFVFFIHPLNPNRGFCFGEDTTRPDSSNYGWAHMLGKDGFWTVTTQDKCIRDTTKYVKVERHTRFGSAMSYYSPDSTRRINRAAATNLACHELGHCFGEGYNMRLKYQEEGELKFYQGLPDRYESDNLSTHYANSAGVGKYTVMQLGYYTLHPQLYTPWERMVEGWIEPITIDTNTQNVYLRDFHGNTEPRLYLIPVDSMLVDTCGWGMWLREYFLLSNYQPDDHWLDDLGETWPGDLKSPGTPDSANGLLIWHINEGFWNPGKQNSEFCKFEDLECAEGLLNLDGTGPSPWGNAAGWDRLDRWCPFSDTISAHWWNDPCSASTSHPHDFFNPAYKTAFHTLMNPSSDGYAWDLRAYPNMTYTYPGGVEEVIVYQNLPTHMSIEGIHYEGGTDIKLCIRRSRIWADEEYAMDRTTQRKFLCDTTDTFHFVYPLKGNIYYTKTYDPSKLWFKAEKVGPHPVYYDSIGYGIWPAMTLNKNRQPLVVFYDTSCSKVIYSYREEVSKSFTGKPTLYDTVWHSPPDTLSLSGDPGPVAIDYGYGSGGIANPGGIHGTDYAAPGGGGVGADSGSVHLAYITRVNGQDQLRYARFLEIAPEDLAEETVDTNLMEDSTRIIGASIEVDNAYNKVYIAYGCVKRDTAACYYYQKDSTGWHGPYKFTLSKSDSLGEPLVPFIDIDGSYIRVVLNANERIYFSTKLRTSAYNFWSPCSLVTQMTGRNRYPQIAGNMVTWTNYVTSDSSNVYGLVWPGAGTIRLDSAYGCINYFCHATKTTAGTACLYQHGTFYHPEPCWAIYYRGPDGFGGNQENDGSGQLLVPKPEEFTMTIYGNVIRSNQFNIFTSGGDCELAVYDITGRRVTKLEIKDVPKANQITTAMDCSKWSKGIYFVRAIPQEGPVRTAKVVLIR